MGRGQELLDAAREGDKRTVEKIIGQITKRSGPFTSLRRGAGVNVQDDNGYTPLHHACLRGHKEIVRLLLSVDASPCVIDKKGATPLHLAAWKGDSDVVEMLLAHTTPAVNVDQLTSDHETALLIAAQFGYVDVVAQLTSRGADVTLRNIKDESPLDLAAQYGRLDTVQYLLRVRPQLVHPYKYPICKYSSTPLHRASKNGHKEVVSTLIAAGFNPNVRNHNGTPLHEAACFGKAGVVRILLAKGADLNATDRRGKTVHDLLADYSEEPTRRVRRVIREYESIARNTYESEEDLPPFPVQDYSPTGYPNYDGMKPTETQKNTKLDSSLSPSSTSLSKNQPQSFVRKLASKLGLKNKFNSAPNINSADSENSSKQKLTEKTSTNTLLIGNSKFFKKLSKKEESGEVVCNDEFDTISLDRLATLNRDSVVNRSNRSCPGFKTSLPNISENNELSDSDSVANSVEITEIYEDDIPGHTKLNEAVNLKPKLSIFEPRLPDRLSVLSENFVNECYEPYEITKVSETAKVPESTKVTESAKEPESAKVPDVAKVPESAKEPNSAKVPDSTKASVSDIISESAKVSVSAKISESAKVFDTRDEKLTDDNKVFKVPTPTPPPRPTVIASKIEESIYQNVKDIKPSLPVPAARVRLPTKVPLDELEKKVLYENVSLSLERKPHPPKRTFVPSKPKSPTHSSPSISRSSSLSSDSMIDETNLEDILLSEKSKSFRCTKNNAIQRTQSFASDDSDITEASALENVDVSEELDDKPAYLSMTGTLPSKKSENPVTKKVLFRHKTFTNIEVDRNSINIKDNKEFMKETLPSYHIRGTGHCIYKAPTMQEFIYIFNRETLYSDVEPFTKVPSNKRDSYFETAICFCKPKPPKHHSSAEDLLDIPYNEPEEKVTIDMTALRKRNEVLSTSFQCFCDSGNCKFHSSKIESLGNLVVKFSAIKRSISTPDITLAGTLQNTTEKRSLTKNKSVPYNLEEPYAVVSVEDIMHRNKEQCKDNPGSPIYSTMSHTSTLSSNSGRPYSIKDIAEVISLNSTLGSADTSLTSHPDNHHPHPNVPLRKSSSEYSGHWSLQSCMSNVTIKSDCSFKTCLEESSDDGTLHSDDDDSSDAETVKSDVSTGKRPWVHSDSFRFGQNTQSEMQSIAESKFESGISVGSSSEGEVESILEEGEVLLEREDSGGVRSGSARRRWDETEGTSEGDALSVSSAASSGAPLHLGHHDYNKVSPTPPKKPPRRNLSVSPTHANSPSSGYSYELRPHARSQDDLDEIQGKHYLKLGRSVDQYVDSKLSYSECEENHNSPRVAPVPNPRPSLKVRTQPVAVTAMYENVVIKEQNPRRKLRRNNFGYESNTMDNRMRKYSNQERSSLESLLDDQSMSPSDCERYYDGQRVEVPVSPTHYTQPPTPEHPPPSARQAENSIHEKIRPLSQEYKRRSALRDSQTEVELNLLRAASAASLASGATDRSGNTDNCVEEYVCDVPFAGLFKGSTTTLDGIGLRPIPAERPKTLRKLKSVYDASPTEPPALTVSNVTSNGQQNGDDEPRKRSNTNSSNSGDKSLSILSPFDEQEEWAKISEIMASFGSKLVRESVFVSELEQEFTTRLGLSCSESSLSPSVASNLGLWLGTLALHDYEQMFLDNGFDDVDFINGVLEENDLKEMGIASETDRHKILEAAKQLPRKITEISKNHNNNTISHKPQTDTVDSWLKKINLEQYSETFRKHLYVDMDRVRRIWEVELTAVLEIQKFGHRKRILASVSGEKNGPVTNLEDINADLNNLKNNIQQLKDEIKEKLPPHENLKAVPPPVVPHLAPPGGETLKRSKKNRPAPQPPKPSDLEIRAPSELLEGVPGALKTQWRHQPFVLVTGAVTYVANYLGSTVVKELRGTESTKKSIQKLKKTSKEPNDSPDIILSISYRGVKFLNTITKELICEHEIRNIHCACQDADDLTHFAYITKDHASKSHYCHVFRVATMDQATEVILTLGEAFEVAYQMALREQSNRFQITQSLAKTPTHDPMTTSNKERVNVNHGRSHSITEIKLNGHQLKIAPMSASLSNEDFQSTRNSDGSRSPRTPLLKAPIASTEEL